MPAGYAKRPSTHASAKKKVKSSNQTNVVKTNRPGGQSALNFTSNLTTSHSNVHGHVYKAVGIPKEARNIKKASRLGSRYSH